MEAEAARWVQENATKPVVGFIAGQTAPPGRRMGHAGAIVGGAEDTAAAKMKIMAECGITVVESPAQIGKAMADALGRSEEHTSELQSLMRISYAVFCLKKKTIQHQAVRLLTPHEQII